MKPELIIAQRTATEHNSSQRVMAHIATAAVAVSIMVMIVSMAVIVGFRREITSLISHSVGEITVTDMRTLQNSESHPLQEDAALVELLRTSPQVVSVEPYIAQGVVLRAAPTLVGAVLRSMSDTMYTSMLDAHIVEGRMPSHNERRKEVALPLSCAKKLGIKCGGAVEVLLLNEQQSPQREVFRVCGIYNLSLDEGERGVVLTHIDNLRRINGWRAEQCSGYTVRLDDFDSAPAVADIINMRLLNEYEGENDVAAVSATELYGHIVGWLATHDINATVIMVIMLVVAFFNMATTLLILVLERTRMIGLLKSLGMPNRSIRSIFHYRAAMILGRGMLWGNVIALVLALLQQHLHIVKLDASGYILSQVPIALNAGWIVAINAGFAATLLVLLTLTTTIVARIEPAKALKYE